ncbi:bifunctional riboflavin kinase/FAD synthetase [Microbacterium sp. MEC084]|jgi:riboflavin kinase/FMN adenylyltransferase|uniref:bifunctional riboflavin kinase/FAD synthetase n=1 Tax=unclassified Microbacterium TaxID=2609290 RepID=UPI0006F35237|nr:MULTISPECIES: bifunctional riboflavin kinase/FAD synthetase [unclassified Microbacterium]KQY97036.1 bifunctional riboflavin kinase/FMN adenylyltransferase [Microbacterium sp. Root53]MCD1268237.1 bifunctional riboflavin kinase/FAD synthetase [Microbacterium sp. MEC084]
MILFEDVADIPADFGPTVIAIGKFDGVHAGHRALIEKMLVDAASTDARTVAVTFDRNPLALLAPERCPRSLVGVTQKVELLGRTGIDATLMLRFDEALASEEPEAFVRRVIVAGLHAQRVLVGSDFRFGRGGAGDAALLRRMGAELGFAVEEVADVASAEDGRRVSSTWIRELLDAGDVERAAKLLGRYPAVTGEVVHGLKRGRELGFPTANLSPDTEGYVPADGVYAGWLIERSPQGVLRSGARYPAAISVGTNPTFDDVDVPQVEAYVIDETGLDLYGRRVEIQFVTRIRGMVAFEGVDKLVEQMTDDVVQARLALTDAAAGR